MTKDHKVLTYIEYIESGVFRTIVRVNILTPHPPPPSECVLPPPHQRRAGGGGGSIFRKTPDIGLSSCSIIPLRERIRPKEGRLKVLLYLFFPTFQPVRVFLNNLVGARELSRNRVIVPARHARLHRLAELVPWNRFLGSIKV